MLSFSPTRLLNSTKHEHSCKILYFKPAAFISYYKPCVTFTSAAYIHVHFRLNVFIEANNRPMDPDQTTRSRLIKMDSHFFLYRLLKKISRREDRARETDGLRVICKWPLEMILCELIVLYVHML